MANRIKLNDTVKIIAGDDKGKVAKVIKLIAAKNQVLLEGIGTRVRHMKKSEMNPMGGKKDIQVPISLSNVALVIDTKTNKTSRVGYQIKDGKKTRVAKQAKNQVIETTVAKVKKLKGAK